MPQRRDLDDIITLTIKYGILMKRRLNMRKRLLSIFMVCCMILGTAAVQVSALGKDVDRSIISANIEKMANYVKENGKPDADNNPTLIYKTKKGVFGAIAIANNQLHFSYNKGTKADDTYVDMYVDFPYSEQMRVTVDVFDEASSNDKTTNDIQDAEALVDPSTFDWNYNDTVKFTITPDSKKAQQTCNNVYGDAMEIWNKMLADAELSVVHLGFSELCSHNGKDVILTPATPESAGEADSTCQWCGKTEHYNIPADNWSASGKTVTVKANALKKKAATVSSSKAFKLANVDYREFSYKKLSGNAKITVNAKTGKLTLKKGLKKGTYKVKVQINSLENIAYPASSNTATVTIKVK